MSYLFCKCGNGSVQVTNEGILMVMSKAHIEETRAFEVVVCDCCGKEVGAKRKSF